MGQRLIEVMLPEIGDALSVVNDPVLGPALSELAGVNLQGVANSLTRNTEERDLERHWRGRGRDQARSVCHRRSAADRRVRRAMRRLLLPAAALLALAACGDDPAAPPEESASAGAMSEAPRPAAAPDAERHPDGTFVHAPDCAKLPAPAAAICLRPVLVAGEANPDLSVETARLDVDGDGRRDMILRRRSKNDCGPGGCATFVLFDRPGGYVLADPPINADGPAEPCRNDGEPGVRFPLAGADAGCIAVDPGV